MRRTRRGSIPLNRHHADRCRMHPDLAPLRHAQTMLRTGGRVDDVIEELRALYRLDFVDAMAAVAASIVLNDGGLTVAEEPFARPYV
jgi:hypothetical protein